MAEYQVSEHTGTNRAGSVGVGPLDVKTHATPEAAAKDILKRQADAQWAVEANKNSSHGNKIGITTIEARAVTEKGTRALTEMETNAIKAAMKATAQGAAENLHRFGIAGKVAGAVVAGTLAAAGGANASEIGREAGDGGLPGVGTLVLGEGPTKGKLCGAFGQVAGALAGIGVGVGTSFTGPVAVAAGIATDMVVTPLATAACNKLTR